MNEPTHRQHQILEGISKGMISGVKNNTDQDNKLYYELCQYGYLKRLVIIVGAGDMRFILTEKAEEYLKSFQTK